MLGDGLLVYVGPGARAARHAHDAVQIVWSTAGPFEVDLDAPRSISAGLVPAGAPHAFDATGVDVALLLVEARGRRGEALRRLAADRAGADVAAQLRAGVTLAEVRDPVAVLSWAEALLVELTGHDASAGAVHPEVEAVLRYVDAVLPGMPRLAEAAAAVAWSSTRLTHVFTEQVGMPFRRFVLWTRLRRAAVAVQDGADLTTAAAETGFADSAHLSRTFRSLFGLAPSDVLPFVRIESRFDRFVQVS